MMNIGSILIESLRLLRAKPKVFIPRLVTTTLYTVYTLYLMQLTVDMAAALSTPAIVFSFIPKFIPLLAAMPILYVMDIVSYAMYPMIVADYRENRPVSLSLALKRSIGAWRVILTLGIVIIVSVAFVSCFSGVAVAAAVLMHNFLLLAFSAMFALAMIILFIITVFFVIPLAIVEGKGVKDSFRESFKLGIKYRVGLFKLNMIFIVVIAATTALALAEKYGSAVTAASVIAFIALRLITAVVYTYLSVTNPMAYLEVRSK